MDYNEFREDILKDPAVRAEYEKLEPEFQIIRAILDARIEQNMSQQELAERTGINRADLSRIENANANPSLKTLKRIAEGLGKKLEIRFM